MSSGEKSGSPAIQTPVNSLSFVIRAYSVLGFLSLGLFGFLHILSDSNPTVGYLELGGAAVFFINVVLLQVGGRVILARNIFLLTVLLFLLVMLVSGGTEETGVYWFFVFPVAAFFLAGKRVGLWWMVALILSMIGTWALAQGDAFSIPYDDVTFRQLLASLIVVAGGIYAYQYSREQLEGEKQASQQELKGEKVRSDVIVQHIDEGIVTTDQHGNITFMNHTAEKLLGWKFAEVKGKRYVDIVPMIDQTGQDVQADSRPLYASLRNGGTVTTSAQYRTKDGKTLPVSVTGSSIKVGDKIIGGIATFRDITEEQDSARAKSEFVTIASHQLRTPISAISWTSELLLSGDGGKLTDEQKGYVDSIYASNKRMAALVNEMLIVSSLEQHTLPVVPEETDLAKVASAVIKEQLNFYKEKDKRIVQNFAKDLPKLPIDEDVLKHILRHLLANSMKYTPKDGHITVNMAVDASAKVRSDSKGSVVITVVDDGYGIPEAATSKIFTKFFRAENIKSKDTDGTGLGLYIVKALIDYVGARISFTSKEGEGTTFTVVLPLEGMAAHMPQPNSVSATSRRSVMKGTAHV